MVFHALNINKIWITKFSLVKMQSNPSSRVIFFKTDGHLASYFNEMAGLTCIFDKNPLIFIDFHNAITVSR